MDAKKKKDKLTPSRNVNADILIPKYVFIISVISLLLFGLVMVFSASNVEAINNSESPYSYIMKQALYCGLGIALAISIWRFVPYKAMNNNFILWFLFGLLLLAMFATLIGGTDILGARRWIYIGGISFQPSEFVKIVVVLIIAKYFSDYRHGAISTYKCVCVVGGVSIGMLGFIYLAQSDLGSTIICAVGILAALWISDLPKSIFIGICIVCVLAGIFIIAGTGWRSNRLVFLDPYNDGANGYGAGYQLIRSYYAFAEGGLFGVGLGNSYEKFQYLPEAETDFIFSIVGEELGLIGSVVVVLLFVALIVSGLIMALHSKSMFSASIIASFTIMIGFQAFLNIFCVIGFSPTTGKPLPFISSGGSSVIASLLMVGLILQASENNSLPDKYEKRREAFKASSVFKGRIQETISSKNNNESKAGKARLNKQPQKNLVRTARPSYASKLISQKNINTKQRSKSATTNNKKKRPSTNSYAYRRSKSVPSFKARSSSLSKPGAGRASVAKQNVKPYRKRRK